jgi:hypothetical protein
MVDGALGEAAAHGQTGVTGANDDGRGGTNGSRSFSNLVHDPIKFNRIMTRILAFEHDLFRKPVSAFRDHAPSEVTD